MKKLCTLFVGLLLALHTFAQTDPTISLAKVETQRIANVNENCRLKFTDAGLISEQDESKAYLVYEIPELSASELKASTLNTISEMYKSPKDVVTTLSESMIQLEGYLSRVYNSQAGDSSYPVDILFTWTMQFKDGKIRINIPKIKQIYITNVPLMGSLRLDMTKPITTLIDKESNRNSVAFRLNDLISAICKNAETANDW